MRIKIKHVIKSIFETANKVKEVMEKDCVKQKQELIFDIVKDLNEHEDTIDLRKKWKERLR